MKKRQAFYSGTNLGRLIESQGLRQDWIAKRAGISKSHLSRIILGERLASEPVAQRIADVLRVDLFFAFELPTRNDKEPSGSHDTKAKVPA